MALVRPREPFVSTALDHPVVLGPGDILHDTHPHVRANPGLFVEVRATIDDGIEQATARPGERSNARRS